MEPSKLRSKRRSDTPLVSPIRLPRKIRVWSLRAAECDPADRMASEVLQVGEATEHPREFGEGAECDPIEAHARDCPERGEKGGEARVEWDGVL